MGARRSSKLEGKRERGTTAADDVLAPMLFSGLKHVRSSGSSREAA